MPAAKRAIASPSPRSTGRAVKVAKKTAASPSKHEVDPVLEACGPVLEALSQAEHLEEACRWMLQSMAPHCLRTPKDQRHKYQADVVDTIARVLGEVEANRRRAVADADAEVAALEARKGTAGGELEAAQARSATAKELRDGTEATMKENQTGVAAASAYFAGAKAKVEELAAETESLTARKSDLESAVETTWKPLVAFEFAGKDWRKRDKTIARVVELLNEFQACQALVMTMSTAFKTKPEDRGAFTTTALEHGQNAFTEQISALEAKIAGAGEEAVARAKAVGDADAALSAATASHNAATDVAIAADNAWAAAESEVVDLSGKIKAFGPQAKQLDKQLKTANACLDAFCELSAQFVALQSQEEQFAPEGVAVGGA